MATVASLGQVLIHSIVERGFEMAFIINEYEWLTDANIEPCRKLLDKLGFKALFNHMEITVLKDVVELSEKQIKRDDVQPLQRNSIYVCCQLPEEFKTKGIELIVRGLQHRISDSVGKHIVLEKIQDAEEGEYYCLPFKVRKDIVFFANSQEVGWYNRPTNVLWVSDVTHYTNHDPIMFLHMLECVHQLKVGGYVECQLNITFGADPEFELVDPATGNILNAANYFTGHTVGHDGHAETGEIRPKPGTSPLKLVRNVRKVISELAHHNKFPDGAIVSAGGGTRTHTGGHIHIGGFTELPAVVRKAIWRLCGKWVINSQGKLRQAHEELWQETGHDLYRPQPHGMEFRGMPSWIVNEEMSKAVLCTFAVVLKCGLYGEIEDSELDKVHKADEKLRNLSLYKPYKKHVDKFIELFVNAKTTLEGRDVLAEWDMKQNIYRPSIQVVSTMPWIQKFFKPVMLKNFEGTIRVSIEFNGTSIQVAGVKRKASVMIRDFAQSHFVEFERLSRTIAPMPGITIYLPAAWGRLAPTTRGKFLKDFKDIVRTAIIEYKDFLKKERGIA